MEPLGRRFAAVGVVQPNPPGKGTVVELVLTVAYAGMPYREAPSWTEPQDMPVNWPGVASYGEVLMEAGDWPVQEVSPHAT